MLNLAFALAVSVHFPQMCLVRASFSEHFSKEKKSPRQSSVYPTGSVSTSRGLRGLIDIYIVDMYQVWMLGPQVSKFTDNGEHTDIMIQIDTPQVSVQVGIPYPLYLL